MSGQRWEVLTLIGTHWQNVWEQDGELWTFDSYEEAEAAMLDHLADCRMAVQSGDMVAAPPRDAFRIVPCVAEVIA